MLILGCRRALRKTWGFQAHLQYSLSTQAFPRLDGTLAPRRGSCDSISTKENWLRDSKSAVGPPLSFHGPAQAAMNTFEMVQVGTLKNLLPWSVQIKCLRACKSLCCWPQSLPVFLEGPLVVWRDIFCLTPSSLPPPNSLGEIMSTYHPNRPLRLDITRPSLPAFPLLKSKD